MRSSTRAVSRRMGRLPQKSRFRPQQSIVEISCRDVDRGPRQTAVDCGQRRLCAVVDPELGVYALDVVARRLLRNEQLVGNLTIRPALRDQAQNLDLPGGQAG